MNEYQYANKLYEDAKKILDELCIPYGENVRVVINRRAKSRWGLSKLERIGGKDYYTIEIAARLLEKDVTYEAAMNTMVHELLHCDRNHRGHTGEWKRCAMLVNAKYPQFNIKRCSSSEEKGITESPSVRRTYKYAIKCERCGLTCYYTKRSRVVQLVASYPGSCTCGKCKSRKLTLKTL